MKRLDWRIIIIVLVVTVMLGGVKKPEVFAGEYVIGLISDLSGPTANIFMDQYDALRVYFEQLNDKGGINGNPVRMFVEDDRAQGARAAPAATKLIGKDVTLLIHASMSSAYEATVPLARKAGIPWLAGGVPHRDSMPPNPEPSMFGHRFLGHVSMGTKVMHYALKDIAKRDGPSPVRLTVGDVDTPENQWLQTKFTPVIDEELGLERVAMFLIPMNTSDFTPLARRVLESGANWYSGYVPYFLDVGMFKKLISLGYKGKYITNPASSWEDLIAIFGSSQFMVISDKTLFIEDLPIHREIREAAKKYKATRDVTHFSYGWALGMMLEAAFRKVGWPYTPNDLIKVLNNLEVNMKGLMYPIKFTPNDHHGPTAFRVYGWDDKKRTVVSHSNWYRIDAQNLKVTDIGSSLP